MDNSNNSGFQKSIWKQTNDENVDDWKLFFDCNPKEKQSSKISSTDQQVKLVNYNSKKNIILGTLVMTPHGIGRLVKQEKNLSSVKLIKTNEDQNFPDDEILMYFPIYIRIIDKDFSNWHKISVPANGSLASIRKILEERKIVEKDKTFTLIFNGGELKEESFFDQLDFRPESRVLLYGLRNNSCKVVRYTTINSWWYTYATDGITFITNKKIKLTGVGLYGSHEGKIQTGSITIHEGNSKNGPYLLEEIVEVPASPNQSDPIYPFMFKKQIGIKPGQDYTIQFHCTNYCYFYYGSAGTAKVVGDKKIEFEFKFTNASSHGTSAEAGNFPELYYLA